MTIEQVTRHMMMDTTTVPVLTEVLAATGSHARPPWSVPPSATTVAMCSIRGGIMDAVTRDDIAC